MPGISVLQNGYTEITSGSDDGDELVAELLEQFALPTTTSSKDRSAQRSQRSSVDAGTTATRENKFVGIKVPRIDDIDEYESLPGHDKVRRILSEGNTPWGTYYWVEFRSGDKDLVSSDRM